MRIPILFISDSPYLQTGLARIGRDLSARLSASPEFRVGYMGLGGITTRKLPFPQYIVPEEQRWGEGHIEAVWKDFAGAETGVVFTIWDAGRLLWFSQPQYCADAGLRVFLEAGKFQRWGYFPVDGHTTAGTVGTMATATISGYDRVLSYGLFGQAVIGKSLGREVDWLPHGIDQTLFQPRGKEAGRAMLGLDKDDFVVGCVMTNQLRKDWGLAFNVVVLLRQAHPNVKFWVHTDSLNRHWDIHALVNDLGLTNVVKVTQSLRSEELSYAYSACDVTMLPSLGEGFGYPIVESLACGVPVVHGNYAGGAELLQDTRLKVNPMVWRADSAGNILRPVYDPGAWAVAVETALGIIAPESYWVDSVEHLFWPNLWPTWRRWFTHTLL